MKKYYSQYGEDQVVSNYLNRDIVSNVLDIGANDGRLLSNSLHFIERGWGATLIEAGPVAFRKLENLHKDNKNIQCLEICLDTVSRDVVFYHNKNHMNKGDTDLLSTIDKQIFESSKYHFPFDEIKMSTKTFEQIASFLIHEEYSIISIDIEGLDYEILEQIDLNKYKCNVLIIEYNGDAVKKNKIQKYCALFGMIKNIHDNGTNIIIAR